MSLSGRLGAGDLGALEGWALRSQPTAKARESRFDYQEAKSTMYTRPNKDDGVGLWRGGREVDCC